MIFASMENIHLPIIDMALIGITASQNIFLSVAIRQNCKNPSVLCVSTWLERDKNRSGLEVEQKLYFLLN